MGAPAACPGRPLDRRVPQSAWPPAVCKAGTDAVMASGCLRERPLLAPVVVCPGVPRSAGCIGHLPGRPACSDSRPPRVLAGWASGPRCDFSACACLRWVVVWSVGVVWLVASGVGFRLFGRAGLVSVCLAGFLFLWALSGRLVFWVGFRGLVSWWAVFGCLCVCLVCCFRAGGFWCSVFVVWTCWQPANAEEAARRGNRACLQ